MALLKDRIDLSKNLMRDDAALCATIDDFEFQRLRHLVEMCFSRECLIGIAVIKNNPSGRSTAKGCRRAFKSDQLCALNFDQGR
jgi:hypothetical protein